MRRPAENPVRTRAGNPAPLAELVPATVAALLPLAPGQSLERESARARRAVTRQLEQLVCRAVWRAERRSRRVPRAVRQSASWVNAQRRKIAFELERAIRQRFGAGEQLAGAVAERACKRFPRDGIVIADDRGRGDRPARETPRARGTAPRNLQTNPRAEGSNPRAVGTAPRQRRGRATAGGVMHASSPATSPASSARATPNAALEAAALELLQRASSPT
jgi:hypothetical protein